MEKKHSTILITISALVGSSGELQIELNGLDCKERKITLIS